MNVLKIALLVIWDIYKSPFSDEIELGILSNMLRQNDLDVKLFSLYPDDENFEELNAFSPDLFGCIVYEHSEVLFGRWFSGLN